MIIGPFENKILTWVLNKLNRCPECGKKIEDFRVESNNVAFCDIDCWLSYSHFWGEK
jgi:predicted glycosyltransferase involved in capsule biosynthesis